jgi:hypothetical protein
MTTIPNFTEITEAWADYARQAIQLPSFDGIPTASELVDATYDRVQNLLDVQRSTLKSLADAWAA